MFHDLVNDLYELHTDASGLGIGAVLNVMSDRNVLPVTFFSRQMSESERNYSATEMEALAVVATVEYFVYFLYGPSFVVYTDYRPLVSLLSSRILNRCLRGMALKLSSYDIDIRYRKGSDNDNAIGLSRHAWEAEIEKTNSDGIIDRDMVSSAD